MNSLKNLKPKQRVKKNQINDLTAILIYDVTDSSNKILGTYGNHISNYMSVILIFTNIPWPYTTLVCKTILNTHALSAALCAPITHQVLNFF